MGTLAAFVAGVFVGIILAVGGAGYAIWTLHPDYMED